VPKRPEIRDDIWAQIGLYSSLGFILPAGAVGGYVIGWLLDNWLHTSPVLSIVMGFAGAAGGLIEILKILGREEKRASGDDANPPGDDGSGPN
jgi:F0F1-type ATP synthase assembly protein I